MAYQIPWERDGLVLGPAHTVRFRQDEQTVLHHLWDPTHAPGPTGIREADTAPSATNPVITNVGT